ncbi:HNH endonuclease [Bacillus sp. FSL W8-0223]|uniref:HNH endonuclease n=1 Tax=Bacillus sp. FSL W8-0223 TaxID=2954595 RepID=UPI0030FB9BED
MKEVPNFNDVRDEMTPLIGFKNYLVHCPSGNVYSLIRNQWLCVDAKGTGDNSNYLMTTLKNDEGHYKRLYIHEIVMSSYMGITKQDWRAMGLEVDHINKNPNDNRIENLRLVTSEANKKNRNMWTDTIRLGHEVAEKLRDEFKDVQYKKCDWYKQKAKELGVSARTIQNVCLGYTYA